MRRTFDKSKRAEFGTEIVLHLEHQASLEFDSHNDHSKQNINFLVALLTAMNKQAVKMLSRDDAKILAADTVIAFMLRKLVTLECTITLA